MEAVELGTETTEDEQAEQETAPQSEEEEAESELGRAGLVDETAPEEPEPTSEAVKRLESGKMDRELEREAKRHRDALDRIMGELALGLEPCPLCEEATAGFRYNVPPDEQQLAAVKVAIGERPDLDFKAAEDRSKCEKCDGLGQVLTGSRVDQFILGPCRQCNGWGYLDAQGNAAAPDPPANMPPVPAPSLAVVPETPATDTFGHPRGHPHYGMLPMYIPLPNDCQFCGNVLGDQ